MAQEMKFQLKTDTGAVTVPIIDEKDGEVIGSFKFNPNDLDIIKRYEKVVESLNAMSVPDNAGTEEIFVVTDEIKRQVDYLLNYNVSSELFAKCNPLTLTSNGDFYVENVLDGIAVIIEQATNQRIEKKKAKIRKATAKYHK